jgi:hypothetical protein
MQKHISEGRKKSTELARGSMSQNLVEIKKKIAFSGVLL